MGSDKSTVDEADSSTGEAGATLQMPHSVTPLRSGFLMSWASEAHRPSRPQSPIPEVEAFEPGTHNLSRDVAEAIEASLRLDDPDKLPASPPRKFLDTSGPLQPHNDTSVIPRAGFIIPTAPSAKIESSKLGYNYSCLAERIWRFNDQNASLYLQERLRYAVPQEFDDIIAAINRHVDALMVHRFGNFLVQCMLELARADEVAQFAAKLEGKVSKMSRHQFCCHVIQKLLDVSSLVIQARVAAELLDDAVATMSSPFGTHVWQKLLHLPWSPELPPITTLANNAVHLESKSDGWMSVAQTEGGAATIKSYLGLPQLDAGRQECINELLNNVSVLMKQPRGGQLICKLTMMSSTRARTMTLVFSKAYEYCKHPVASSTLIHLIKLKIPSFPIRLSAALAPYNSELSRDEYGALVLASLNSVCNIR